MLNTRPSRLLATLCFALVMGALSPSVMAADAPVATVNNKAISKAQLDSMVKLAVREGQKDSPELREFVKNLLIGRELIMQEIDRRGLTKSEDIKIALDNARTQVLGNALLQELLKANPIKDEEIKAEYEQYKTAATNDKEYHARHILVETEDQAKAIIDQLKKGAKFEDLAKQSKDPGSASNGGDLGWTSPRAFVREFGEAMTKLEKGKFTDTPVKTQFGFHVIRLDDSRPVKVQTQDELKPRIIQALQQRRLAQLQQELKAKATIK